MTLLPAILSTFSLAFFYFWPAVPAGLALGMPPLLVILTTSASYALGVALVTVAGEAVRTWIMRRMGKRAILQPDSFIGRVWERYGVVGLGLLAPMTIGSQLGAALGVTLGAPRNRLIFWMCVGGFLWSVVLTALVSLGVLGVQSAG